MDSFLVALGLVSGGIVIWLTVLLDRVNARLDFINARLDGNARCVNRLAGDQAEVLKDIRRRAKRRAREAAATESQP